eukprot:TRINITY_DN17393_c0_g1_i1.p2 TRINITY_DN17393_c0_g1~~TRINITY_DN17393_c0_g1_i1.p2  ORF type:complete len:344 (-),score=71.45 TRINITY_DN17393_c0_g1_i1:120-1070(-)
MAKVTSAEILADQSSFRKDIKIYYRGDREVEEPFTLKKWRYRIFPEDKIVLLIWDEAKKRNPLEMDAVWENLFLIEHFERAEDVNVVVWTGDGPVWSSGFGASMAPVSIDSEICDGYRHVKKGVRDDPQKDGAAMDIVLKGMLLRMQDFSKISVVACNGMAVGGGANMAFLMHDFVFLEESGKFRYPFIDLGITAEVGSTYFLPRIVGPVKAKEILMTGRWFTSREADKWNLCTEVVPDGYVVPRALEYAKPLSQGSQISLRNNKRMINMHPTDLESQLTEENRTFATVMSMPETMQLMAAFAKKHGGGGKPKSKL